MRRIDAARLILLLAPLLSSTGAGSTEQPRACTSIGQALAANVSQAAAWSVRLIDGVVIEVVLRANNGSESRSEMTPVRPGVSYRQLLEPVPGAIGPFRTVFNLVTVEPDGTVLAETWVRFAGLPEGTRYSWTRLRCPAG